MTKALVSAVIPAYQAELFIGEAINSVLNQSYDNVECIVVDDGSTDQTAELTSAYGPSVRLVAQGNKGVSAARNKGWQEAKGAYVAFLDADDVWLPHKIERQMERVATDPSLALVYTGLTFVSEDLQTLEAVPASPPEVAMRNMLLMRGGVMSVAQTGLFRRDVLETIGGFDEQMSTSADADLAIRVALAHPVTEVPEALVLYRQHGAQMHDDLQATERDMLRIFDKTFTSSAPHEIAVLRRKARGALFTTLALGYFQRGRRADAMRRAWSAVLAYPPSVAQLAARARSYRGSP